ncbi:porin [Vibrio sp. SCSIO 43136]|uniref:porin n=1 Tax=Vibrio sp. SCSIO 43136 TaxID=2819101 RepID=UPI0020755BD4|nr:porin [Vibrio sp. SCSIO 43136]USD64783.1 porin [Vibrio sp. SCSIO 43136]
MNKKMIALVVAAAASTGATAAEVAKTEDSSLAIGGRIEARLAIQDGKAEDQSRVRLNVAGETQIADGLTGIGFYEGEYKATKYNSTDNKHDTDTLEHRYMYTGVAGDFGKVTVGTVNGSLQKVTDFTDIMSYHGNGAAPKLDVADRPDRSIAYAGEFAGLEVRANYAFESAVANSEGKLEGEKNSGYALSGIYNIGETGARVTAAYAQQDNGETKENKQAMAGASYELGNIYVAGLYTYGKENVTGADNTKTNGYELAAAYKLGQAKFTTTYNRLDNEVGSSAAEKATDAIAVDATYYFNANFRTYASYKFNLLKEEKVGAIKSQDQAVLGLRYDF